MEEMIAAVDIGGTKIAVGMIDDQGRVRARFETPTSAELGYKNALDRTTKLLRDASVSAGAKITGIGIGSTGPIDPFTGEIGEVNFFPAWMGENPVKDLEGIFQVSVAIENDADAAALAEASWGAGKGRPRLIYVTIGTGIGVAVILDGKIYRGVAQTHPEIGHHLLDPSGPECWCGFHGCWESLAAGPAMVGWIQKNAPAGYPHLSGLTAKRICELAREKDGWATRAVENEGRYLGYGMANLVTIFVPDVIVLGGSVMNSADLFLGKMREIIAASCRFVPHEKTELALASLGEDANLIGAARVWHHRFGSEGEDRGS
jgi:glucokinase